MAGWWNDPTSKHAFNLSVLGVILEFLATALFILMFLTSGSILSLVFALENCVDFISSVVVLWRFYCPGKLTQEREEMLRHREKRASLAISFVLLILGISVTITAGLNLSEGAGLTYSLDTLVYISFASIFIFGALTIIKFRYARKLESASLYKDAVCSTIGCVLATGLFFNTLIIQKNPNVWWLDPVIAVLCGIAATILGFHAIVVASCIQGLPIFNMEWWMSSQGDGLDEVAGRDLEPADFGEPTAEKDTGKATELTEIV